MLDQGCPISGQVQACWSPTSSCVASCSKACSFRSRNAYLVFFLSVLKYQTSDILYRKRFAPSIPLHPHIFEVDTERTVSIYWKSKSYRFGLSLIENTTRCWTRIPFDIHRQSNIRLECIDNTDICRLRVLTQNARVSISFCVYRYRILSNSDIVRWCYFLFPPAMYRIRIYNSVHVPVDTHQYYLKPQYNDVSLLSLWINNFSPTLSWSPAMNALYMPTSDTARREHQISKSYR